MIIAAPATESKTEVDDFFGRAPYLAVRNTETGETDFIDNPAVSAESGAGVKAAQVMIDNHVEAVCMPQCGKNAQDALLAAGIKILRNVESDLEASFAAMAAGQLEELADAHGGFHWGGAR